MDKKYILAIDRGQSCIKAAFCNLDGSVVCVESRKCQPIESPRPGWAQQDMNRIWEQAALAIRSLFRKSDICSMDVAAVSFCGQGGGNFLVSEDGEAAYPGILSMDSRHEAVAAGLENPGNVEIPRTVAFMRWLKEEEPETFQKTRWILGSKDWIRYCLTGKANADMSDPPAPVNLDTGEYQTECLEAAGIPECLSMLPPLAYASEICGAVTKEAAERTGLMEGTPVVAGAHDMIACSIGSGGNRQGHLAIIMGTMGINIAVADRGTRLKEAKDPGESFTFGGVSKDFKTVTTSIGSGCNTMNYFLDLMFEKEKLEAEEQKISVFELLEERLSEKKPSSVLFQPYLMGTFYNSSAKAGLIGITANTTREEILLALFQGICISMCMEIGKLEERMQEEFQEIWMVGGGSGSRIWGQMYADVLKRPVHIGKDSEAGCRGAAICAGVALGRYGLNENFPKPVAAMTYYPRKENARWYEKQLALYREAYDLSAKIWDRQQK